VALIRKGRDNIDTFSFGSAWMGLSTHPFIVNGDPNEADFKIDSLSLDPRMEDRMDDRTRLLGSLDTLRRDLDHAGSLASMDEFNRQALEMLTSDKVHKAFDLSGEPEALRDRYGRHAWGQRALLARRLVEAGSSFVTVVMENPYVSGITMPKNGTYNWDSHAVNCDLFADARIRLPLYDQVITALVEDLYARGLDRKVLLVVTGEFGRTPKVSLQTGTQTGVQQPGRDHWPSAMSMLVSGGGMATGQIIGATNKFGEHPVERPLSPNDLWATVYRHLGIDYHRSFLDFTGRPMPILSEGTPIAEMLPRA
jgi:hypothetical protein